MTAFVTLDSLSLASPEGQPLFHDLTFALGRERVGVVGRNGSGKSTLLRAIVGEIEPAAGSIHRAGSIGLLQQALDDSLTVDFAAGGAIPVGGIVFNGNGQDGSGAPAGIGDWLRVVGTGC